MINEPPFQVQVVSTALDAYCSEHMAAAAGLSFVVVAFPHGRPYSIVNIEQKEAAATAERAPFEAQIRHNALPRLLSL
jgi:hypothetical protein